MRGWEGSEQCTDGCGGEGCEERGGRGEGDSAGGTAEEASRHDGLEMAHATAGSEAAMLQEGEG